MEEVAEKEGHNEEEEEDKEEGAGGRKRKRMGGRGGGSADGGDKKQVRGRNRPPFVKCLTTKQPFTVKELKHDLSGENEVIYESRWTPCSRVVEDDFQIYTNHLPFGMRVHRR